MFMEGRLKLQAVVKKVTHHNFRGLRRLLIDPPTLTQLFTPPWPSFAACHPCPKSKNHMHIEKQSCELGPGHWFPSTISILPNFLTFGSFLSSLYFPVLPFLNNAATSYF